MAEKLTPQQFQAIHDRGGKLLVSASAGSGKTKVLVDRLLSYLTDSVAPANLDEFLIITYTKAAAAELRSKIAAKLTERIAQDPTNRHLQQQMQRLYLTKISTVHSFCSDILREYAYRLDIAADFRVADENECQELQLRVLENLLDHAYDMANDNPDFQVFVDTQGLGRDDRQIPDIILKVYHSAMCHLDPEKWLTWCEKAADVDTLTDASETVWGRYLIEDLRQYLELQIDALQNCLELAAAAEGMLKPAALLESTIRQLKDLHDADSWDQIVSRKNVDYGRLVFAKNCSDLQLADQIKAIRSACKSGLDKKLRSFSDDSTQVLRDLSLSCSASRGLIRLVRQFASEYDRLKRSRRVLDFGDLEHKMLDLLLGRRRSGPSAASVEIAARFREIMVDEYQDSNAVQDAIFSVLTDKRKNCFMVGDVKQSIYQFRLADPSIFIEKYNSYLPAEKAEAGQGRKILLSSNFRSSCGVISAVNDVFSACMSPAVGGLEYGQEEMLHEGIPHIELDEPEVELYGLEVKEDTYAEEASFVADRIAALLDGSHYVRSGDELRPILPQDIVILLRSPGSVGGEFQYALELRGIRCTTGASIDLLQTEEIGVLRALLQIISNPLQDIPLLAVLSSRVFGFTADDLAFLRGEHPYGSVYDSLCKVGTEKSEHFLKILDELRAEARMYDLPRLIQKILSLTQLDVVYSAMPDGMERNTNLQAFCCVAAEYDSSGKKGLDGFLEYLELMEEKGLSISGEAQDGCVTIMSIHKSKGLEFPVVCLCGLSRSFNMESARAQVLCHKQMGLGLNCVDTKLRVRYPSIAKRAISSKIISECISEEMRVLYVAMTRARDRLIMTYALKNLQAELQDMLLRMPMSSRLLMTGEVDCPGSWVLQTALGRTEAGEFFRVAGVQAQAKYKEPTWLIRTAEATFASGEVQTQGEIINKLSRISVDKLRKGLMFCYPYSHATQAPSKQTATQLKGRPKDQEAAADAPEGRPYNRSFRKPSFVGLEEKGKTYGNALHAVMQYIRYEACTDTVSIKNEISRLVSEQMISEEQGNMVDCEKINAFFSTDLGKKLMHSTEVLREFKFSILDDSQKYIPELTGEKILLQGVIDCALVEPDGIIVVDFKTDRVTQETLLGLTERYRPQVVAYADALRRIYQKNVKKVLLYFFELSQFVSLQ